MAITNSEYIAHNAQICPSCKSDNISGTGMIDMDFNWTSCGVECLDCKATWEDIYEVTSFTNLVEK